MKLVASSATYKFSLDELKVLFADVLQVNPERVSVEPEILEVGDYMDRYVSTKFVGLKVVVKGEGK